MPCLSRLTGSAIRNLQPFSLEPGAGFNLIYGENGSGKTSLLEAISLLSIGRSFRTHQQRPLIQEGQREAVVHGDTAIGTSLGIRKSLREAVLVKINGQRVSGVADLARELPVQVLHADSFALLEAGPGVRRAFLDWGVFHVKPSFMEAWRRARRALVNRNALLKQNATALELEPWSRELAQQAEHIDVLRRDYLAAFAAVLASGVGPGLESVLGGAIALDYASGWSGEGGLLHQLLQHVERERKVGHTLFGPHRAEIRLLLDGKDCAPTLSRGQTKLLVSGLKVAQAEHLHLETGVSSVFLVDDLPAELDKGNQARVVDMLASLQTQIFLTAVESNVRVLLPRAAVPETGLFHVKHGKIQQLDPGLEPPE